jgi:prepilin-type N-terminal cleavage/methylation domain-containing protein
MKYAFSLIEIMVAVAILGVIIVGLLAMFYQTQRAFRTGLTQVDVLEGGRAAMELISRDLQDAAASSEVLTTNFQINMPAGYSGMLTLPLLGSDTADVLIEDVSFLRRHNDDWTGESLRVANADLGVGTLYRLLVVTNRYYIGQLSEYTRSAPLNTNFMRVADGIVHFRVRPFDSKGLMITNLAPGFVGDPSKVAYLFYSNNLPPYVDIELAILEPKAVEQFRARTNNMVKAREYLLKQAGRIHFFKERVALRNAPEFLSVTNVP